MNVPALCSLQCYAYLSLVSCFACEMLITEIHWNDLLVEYIKFFHVYVNVFVCDV